MKKKFKHAFSLIELSIVILVIGILVIGVTKGSRILYKSRLSSARALTTSSPVALVPGIKVWLEATTAESFNNDQDSQSMPQNGSAVATWYDINPHTSSQNNATSAATKPIYVDNGINNLPSLSFDSTKYITITNTNILNTGSYTMFVVEKRASTAAMGVVGANFTGTAIFYRTPTELDVEHFVSNGAGGADWTPVTVASFANLVTRITSVTYLGANSTMKVYTDGYIRSNGGRGSVPAGGQYSIGQSYAGVGGNYNGYIGEVILFDRVLSSTERHGIESYLGSKWGVQVASQ